MTIARQINPLFYIRGNQAQRGALTVCSQATVPLQPGSWLPKATRTCVGQGKVQAGPLELQDPSLLPLPGLSARNFPDLCRCSGFTLRLAIHSQPVKGSFFAFDFFPFETLHRALGNLKAHSWFPETPATSPLSLLPSRLERPDHPIRTSAAASCPALPCQSTPGTHSVSGPIQDDVALFQV